MGRIPGRFTPGEAQGRTHAQEVNPAAAQQAYRGSMAMHRAAGEAIVTAGQVIRDHGMRQKDREIQADALSGTSRMRTRFRETAQQAAKVRSLDEVRSLWDSYRDEMEEWMQGRSDAGVPNLRWQAARQRVEAEWQAWREKAEAEKYARVAQIGHEENVRVGQRLIKEGIDFADETSIRWGVDLLGLSPAERDAELDTQLAAMDLAKAQRVLGALTDTDTQTLAETEDLEADARQVKAMFRKQEVFPHLSTQQRERLRADADSIVQALQAAREEAKEVYLENTEKSLQAEVLDYQGSPDRRAQLAGALPALLTRIEQYVDDGGDQEAAARMRKALTESRVRSREDEAYAALNRIEMDVNAGTKSPRMGRSLAMGLLNLLPPQKVSAFVDRIDRLDDMPEQYHRIMDEISEMEKTGAFGTRIFEDGKDITEEQDRKAVQAALEKARDKPWSPFGYDPDDPDDREALAEREAEVLADIRAERRRRNALLNSVIDAVRARLDQDRTTPLSDLRELVNEMTYTQRRADILREAGGE